MELSIDAAWASGYVLAMTRVAAFVLASPLVPRSLPLPGRLGFVVVVGLALTGPLADTGLPVLLSSVAVNVAIGLLLGWLTGVVLHLFTVAGDLLDVTSGLSVGMVFDPLRGGQGAVLGRLFPLSAVTIFLAVGGLGALVRGLHASVVAVPLDGSIRVHAGMVQLAIEVTARLLVAGVELALPAAAALFLGEVVLGVASRFAPQANVLMLGLPLKILILLGTLGLVVALFPEAMAGVFDTVGDTFRDAIAGLTPGANS